MGAEDFSQTSRGDTASQAFNSAVETAQYEHGHSGYTGTIAEKPGFRMVTVPEGKDIYDYVDELMYSEGNEDHWINDKWGDAGCIEITKGKYFFFGIASS